VLALFFLGVLLLFIGGAAAVLYSLFSEYTGAKNWWLLFCCAPVAVLALVLTVVVSLYQRFGGPLEEIFGAIDAIARGDLSARVPEERSDMYSELNKRFNKMAGELERAEQQRRNLTADIAHELRTPLHIIQGNLEGLIDGVYQPTPEHLGNTLEETRLLARLVDDLQTLSLAESGQLPLHPTRFAPADLLTDLTSSFSARAAALGIELQTALDETQAEITADYDRLNQVLSNLISNALRHTPRGGRIVIEIGALPGEAPGLRIQVKDSGAGIPAQDLPFIFDRFWRGDRARTRGRQASSGLGLSIARQLVEAHGGTITAQSVLGIGSNFIVDLPERGQGP
jgi:two-component system OmpR family sensor kinase/two-component system sensor histidine kinase BaeS